VHDVRGAGAEHSANTKCAADGSPHDDGPEAIAISRSGAHDFWEGHMRITAIRIRKLVSRATGYGHDAAEIEAALEDGDDPDTVATELRQRVDTEIRHSQERSLLDGILDELRYEVVRLERQRDGLHREIDDQRKIINDIEKLAEMANTMRIVLPPALDDLLRPC
jgi:hypothetical protein